MRHFTFILFCGATLLGQTAQAPSQPPVRVNVLNVCTPNADDQKTLAAALARIPATPLFANDFEVSRGRTSLPDNATSNWVRVRREFAAKQSFVNAQYSLSVDAQGVVETLVLRPRDPADLVQISFEASASSGGVGAVLTADTLPERVRLERMGKPAIVLARCPGAGQKPYAELFTVAAGAFTRYRKALDVRRTLPAELAKLGVVSGAATPKKP